MRALRLSIASKMENIALVADCLRGLMQASPFVDSCRYDLELAVVEALTNVVKHAYGGEPEHFIDVGIFMYPDHWLVEIEDRGKTLEKATLDVDTPPSVIDIELTELPESGWGIYLINHCVDDVDYYSNDSGNKLSFRKYFPSF
jgi:serine/threonine-protein kinase RsbW